MIGQKRFRYVGFDVDAVAGHLSCNYSLGEHRFTERYAFGAGLEWGPAALEAARIVFLLAGVSYYKADPAPVLDLGDTTLRRGEAEFLRNFYVHGLGEFAYRNDLDLQDLSIEAVERSDTGPEVGASAPASRTLVPFGGGLDSFVSVDLLDRAEYEMALFVLHRAGSRFAAIEEAAAVTGHRVLRTERSLDPLILRSDELGFRNGHVPITGVLSAVAVLRAVLDRRPRVVMSNEWSASSGNLVHRGLEVNHQYSKSLSFEAAFRGVLSTALPGMDYFSLLRPRSELWIAQRFAGLERFHAVFHSCNRAFHLDERRRLRAWCGRCDKCCFIDLILAPFLSAEALQAVFGGAEPLDDPGLEERFAVLCDLGERPKPFECVGDVTECRAAAVLAAERADRASNPVLRGLMSRLGPGAARARDAVPSLLDPLGPDHLPDDLRLAAQLG